MDQSSDIVQTDQYLTFTLDKETYAIEIVKVREVIDYAYVTRVPRMPAYLCGVINLRGSVVPVIDLRLILGMDAAEKTIDTCIVIAEVSMEDDILHVGMLADSVQEVIDVDPGQIDPPPRLGTRLDTGFIKGMGKRDDRFFIILNIDKVLTGDEMATLQHAAATRSAVAARAESGEHAGSPS